MFSILYLKPNGLHISCHFINSLWVLVCIPIRRFRVYYTELRHRKRHRKTIVKKKKQKKNKNKNKNKNKIQQQQQQKSYKQNNLKKKKTQNGIFCEKTKRQIPSLSCIHLTIFCLFYVWIELWEELDWHIYQKPYLQTHRCGINGRYFILFEIYVFKMNPPAYIICPFFNAYFQFFIKIIYKLYVQVNI